MHWFYFLTGFSIRNRHWFRKLCSKSEVIYNLSMWLQIVNINGINGIMKYVIGTRNYQGQRLLTGPIRILFY